MIVKDLIAALQKALGSGQNISNSNPLPITAIGPGVNKVAMTTIDLNQAAGAYTLFAGVGQTVQLESLIFKDPIGAAGGALTSILIQTDDATPQVIIPASVGKVANLTSENQLFTSGQPVLVGVGKHIQLTINGGATGVAYVCTVVANYSAVVAGGSLA